MTYEEAYQKGRTDEYSEIISKYLLLTEEQVSDMYIRSITGELITLDAEEIENVLNIRNDGKYCKLTDKYLITVTRRNEKLKED